MAGVAKYMGASESNNDSEYKNFPDIIQYSYEVSGIERKSRVNNALNVS